MTTYRRNAGDGLAALFKGRRLNRGAAWGLMIITALIAFEIFNYSTTQFALADVLGDLKFAGFRWATILAFAFCGIDFAGIARIFTPQQGRDEPAEVWYLFGAWLLAAAMNATLTWWGVAVAVVNNPSHGTDVIISSATMTKAVPIFVAAMVLLIRILLIGTFSIAGDNLFTTIDNRAYNVPRPSTQDQQRTTNQPGLRPASTLNRPVQANNYRPAPKPVQQTSFAKPEPTYHNVSFNGQNNDRSYDA